MSDPPSACSVPVNANGGCSLQAAWGAVHPVAPPPGASRAVQQRLPPARARRRRAGLHHGDRAWRAAHLPAAGARAPGRALATAQGPAARHAAPPRLLRRGPPLRAADLPPGARSAWPAETMSTQRSRMMSSAAASATGVLGPSGCGRGTDSALILLHSARSRTGRGWRRRWAATRTPPTRTSPPTSLPRRRAPSLARRCGGPAVRARGGPRRRPRARERSPGACTGADTCMRQLACLCTSTSHLLQRHSGGSLRARRHQQAHACRSALPARLHTTRLERGA